MAKPKPLLARKLVSPLAALVDDRLSYQERSVLLALYSFKGTQTYVYPSREQVAQRAGIGRVERISNLTTSLEKYGWLSKEKRGWTGRNQYTLLIPIYMIWTSFGEALVTINSIMLESGTMSSDITPMVVKDNTSIVPVDSTINKQTILTNQINRPLMGESELFNFFFEQYPKQVGRKQALVEWNKLNLKEKDLNKIIINITDRLTQGVWSLETKQFIPHPANYLSGEQWDDELISRNKYEQHNKLSPTQRLRDNLFSKSNMV
jgi:hypothetical protein